MKLSKYTVLTGNQNPDHRMTVHYTTAEPRQLHACFGASFLIYARKNMNEDVSYSRQDKLTN